MLWEYFMLLCLGLKGKDWEFQYKILLNYCKIIAEKLLTWSEIDWNVVTPWPYPLLGLIKNVVLMLPLFECLQIAPIQKFPHFRNRTSSWGYFLLLLRLLVTCSWGYFIIETLKYWIGAQKGQSYLVRRRSPFSLGWPPCLMG